MPTGSVGPSPGGARRRGDPLVWELSGASGGTERDVAEALRRQAFGARVTADFAALQADADGWADYLCEVECTNVGDGIDP